MKKFLLAAMLASTVMVGASAAYADTFTLTFPAPTADGSTSANYGRDGITGSFTDTWNFTLPSGLSSATISSILTATSNNVNFTTVTLDGVPLLVDSTGSFESRHILNVPITSGVQTLVVTGTLGTGTGTGAYGGVISFSPAVPEPATWALMILGVGLAGGAIRASRRRTQASFA